MFTIKAFVNPTLHYGYEALWYEVDEDDGRVTFDTPQKELSHLRLKDGYTRIVVENAMGKTVENVYPND